MNGLHDLCGSLAQCLLGLLGRHLNSLGQTSHEVTSSDIHIIHFRSLVAGTDLDLQILCGSLTDEQIMFFTHISHNGFIKIIACDLDGSTDYSTSQRYDCDIGSTAADIYDHITARLGNINTCTDSSCDGFLNNGNLSGTCLVGSIFYCLLLYLCNAAGNTDSDTGLTESSLPQRFLDKVFHHFLGYGIIRDNTLT